jgi:ADP-ribose pyrophosphatase YjhB (NUDIX family)
VTAPVREWLVAGGLVEGPGGILLVQNRRRNGSVDWSPPGGVIEVAEGETVTAGLTREVAEETGITVTAWDGPLYRVEAVAAGLGWLLRAEVYRAAAYTGELDPGDPDGIVVDARFVEPAGCIDWLEAAHQWVREPLLAWLGERWAEARSFRYRIDGQAPGSIVVTREED